MSSDLEFNVKSWQIAGDIDEMGCPGRGAVLTGPHCRGHRRPLEPAHPARMLSSYSQVRRIPVVAWDYPAPARRPAEEARALWGAAQDSLPGSAQALRV